MDVPLGVFLGIVYPKVSEWIGSDTLLTLNFEEDTNLNININKYNITVCSMLKILAKGLGSLGLDFPTPYFNFISVFFQSRTLRLRRSSLTGKKQSPTTTITYEANKGLRKEKTI